MKKKHFACEKIFWKRSISVLFAAGLMFALAACAGADSSANSSPPMSAPATYRSEPAAPSPEMGTGDFAPGSAPELSGFVKNEMADEKAPLTQNNLPQDGRKIILNTGLEIETKDFPDSCAAIRGLVAQNGGYLSSSETFTSYNGQQASFTAMIPAEKHGAFLSALEGSATITRRSDSSQDITADYIDVEARLNALRTQEKRLTELMAQAQNLTDLIAIQDKLTDVQYEIERYTSTQRSYDQLVAYSTVSITVCEVREITSPQPVSFWDKAGRAFTDSWNATFQFAQNVGIGIIFSLPALLFIGILALVVLLIIRRQRKKKAAQPKPAMPPIHETPMAPAPNANALVPGNTLPTTSQKEPKDK